MQMLLLLHETHGGGARGNIVTSGAGLGHDKLLQVASETQSGFDVTSIAIQTCSIFNFYWLDQIPPLLKLRL